MSSQVLWFVSRGSGLALLAGFSAVAVLGIAARLGSVPRGWSRLGLGELHRTLALFCVAFLVLHVLTAILDPYVMIGWAATVLPFASPYRATAIGLGALAVDLGGAVLITSLARRRLGYRAWRAVHWLGYLGLAGRVLALGHRRHRPADLVGGAGGVGLRRRGRDRLPGPAAVLAARPRPPAARRAAAAAPRERAPPAAAGSASTGPYPTATARGPIPAGAAAGCQG